MFVPGYTKAVAVTPSDTVNHQYGFTQKAFYVGGAGNLTYIPVGVAGPQTPFTVPPTTPAAVLLSAIPVGTIMPVQAKRINATGTSATLIIALGD